MTQDASDSETVTNFKFARLYPNTHAGYWGSPSQGCLGPLLHYTALRHSLATGDSQLVPDSDSRVCYYACLSRYDYDIVRGIYLSLSTPRPCQSARRYSMSNARSRQLAYFKDNIQSQDDQVRSL